MTRFLQLLHKQPLFLDGAMGTQLTTHQRNPSWNPTLLNFTHPQEVESVHRAYVQAGAQAILTNTFQANPFELRGSGKTTTATVQAAVVLARKAGAPSVLLDVGPLGELLAPSGRLTFEEAYQAFSSILQAGEQAGCDAVFFETFSDLYELKAAILAAKEQTKFPILASMTFQPDGRTFTGTDPQTAAVTLDALGVDALGINCSSGPELLLPLLKKMATATCLPLIAKPNAGLPVVRNRKAIYPLSPHAFAQEMKALGEWGISILGGCCGTTPEHIQALTHTTFTKKTERKRSHAVFVSSFAVSVDMTRIPIFIGERINPSGRPLLQQALLSHSWDPILEEAVLQERAQADLLDVNVGVPGGKEEELLPECVRRIQEVCTLPFCIDSANPDALAAAARAYNGRMLLNSVDASDQKLEQVLPIAQKYGALLVGLTLDETGIPTSNSAKIALAQKILSSAADYQIDPSRVWIDPLAFPLATNPSRGKELLSLLHTLRYDLGCSTILGLSNLSFGLPNREQLNASLLSAACGVGLHAALVNPLSAPMQQTAAALKLLYGLDPDAATYIEQATPPKTNAEKPASLYDAICSGRKEAVAPLTREALKTQAPLAVIENHFVKALDAVGGQYGEGNVFLPQLLQAAEAVKVGMKLVKEALLREQPDHFSTLKKKIVVATVRGDIHDIGKNIAKFLLENYGYEVIDLGKDVPAEQVAEALLRERPPLIGLSALMTTTVQRMEETIALIRKTAPCKVMVGGAILNPVYAKKIGADYYVRDAREGVEVAKEVFAALESPSQE